MQASESSLAAENLLLASMEGNTMQVKEILERYFPCKKDLAEISPDTTSLIRNSLPVRLNITASRCPLCLATVFNKLDTVTALLNDGRFDPSIADNFPIRMASLLGHSSIVSLLLSHPKVNPGALKNYAFRKACGNSRYEVVRLLMQDPRVDPLANDGKALHGACANGDVRIVKLLLTADFSLYQLQDALIKAVNHGHPLVVAVLMRYTNIDPSFGDAYPLRLAARRKNVGVVRVLLKDERVSPRIDGVLADIFGARRGHCPHVARLLFAHTTSIHYFGPANARKSISTLVNFKLGRFTFYQNHVYDYDILEQVLRCQMNVGMFDWNLYANILYSDGAFLLPNALDTIDYCLKYIGKAHNYFWLLSTIWMIHEKVGLEQLDDFILFLKESMLGRLERLASLLQENATVSEFFFESNLSDIIPLLLHHQLVSYANDCQLKL